MGAAREPVPGLRMGHAVADFLADLTHANRAAATIRAYRSDLASFTAHHRGPPESITVEVLRGYFATLTHLAPATRARREATLASFLRWAYRQDLIAANPMDKLDRVRLPAPAPRGLGTGQVAAILGVIPRHRLRDRVLFGLIAETGLRAGEALGVHVEDLDLTPGDEHLRVLGKGGRTRTVLLDDDRLVATLRRYLSATGYRSGPLFRAEKNHAGGPLRYASAQTRWAPVLPHRRGGRDNAPAPSLPRHHGRRRGQPGHHPQTPRARQPANRAPLRQRTNPITPPTPNCAPGAAGTAHDPDPLQHGITGERAGKQSGVGPWQKTPLQEATGRSLLVISQLANASREPMRFEGGAGFEPVADLGRAGVVDGQARGDQGQDRAVRSEGPVAQGDVGECGEYATVDTAAAVGVLLSNPQAIDGRPWVGVVDVQRPDRSRNPLRRGTG